MTSRVGDNLSNLNAFKIAYRFSSDTFRWNLYAIHTLWEEERSEDTLPRIQVDAKKIARSRVVCQLRNYVLIESRTVIVCSSNNRSDMRSRPKWIIRLHHSATRDTSWPRAIQQNVVSSFLLSLTRTRSSHHPSRLHPSNDPRINTLITRSPYFSNIKQEDLFIYVRVIFNRLITLFHFI